MVFCGEVVVDSWWDRGFWVHGFLGVKIFLGFGIYFLGGWSKSEGNDKSEGNNFVASPFGLRSGLRQSGTRLLA
jgi:hypothetical protein